MSGELVAMTFPDAEWTGSSNIHRSIAREMYLDMATQEFLGSAKPDVVMRVLVRADYHKTILKSITQMPLAGCEWLHSEAELAKLVYYLTYRSLQHDKPGLRGKRIINSSTGNVFIPVALKDKIVLGIRFWAGTSEGYGPFRLGFRIRFVAFKEETKEREKAKQAVQEMTELTESVAELKDAMTYMEIAEPIQEEEADLRVRIRLPGESYD